MKLDLTPEEREFIEKQYAQIKKSFPDFPFTANDLTQDDIKQVKLSYAETIMRQKRALADALERGMLPERYHNLQLSDPSLQIGFSLRRNILLREKKGLIYSLAVHAAREGKSFLFQQANELQMTLEKEDKSSDRERISSMAMAVDVLFIDELGAENQRFKRSEIYPVIAYRFFRRMQVVASTSLPVDFLNKMYGARGESTFSSWQVE